MKHKLTFLIAFLCAAGCGQSEHIKITKAKQNTYYGKWTTGELLGKYCNNSSWRYDAKADRVKFEGKLKKTGKNLSVRFHVFFGWWDKSNTKKDWIVVDEGAVLDGNPLTLWKTHVFVDEYRKMGAGKNGGAK